MAMVDYSERPDERPWARDLGQGDKLSAAQASAICETRLRDYGLILVPAPRGEKVIVVSQWAASVSR